MQGPSLTYTTPASSCGSSKIGQWYSALQHSPNDQGLSVCASPMYHGGGISTQQGSLSPCMTSAHTETVAAGTAVCTQPPYTNQEYSSSGGIIPRRQTIEQELHQLEHMHCVCTAAMQWQQQLQQPTQQQELQQPTQQQELQQQHDRSQQQPWPPSNSSPQHMQQDPAQAPCASHAASPAAYVMSGKSSSGYHHSSTTSSEHHSPASTMSQQATATYGPSLQVQVLDAAHDELCNASQSSMTGQPEVASPPSTPGSVASFNAQQHWMHHQQLQQQQQLVATHYQQVPQQLYGQQEQQHSRFAAPRPAATHNIRAPSPLGMHASPNGNNKHFQALGAVNSNIAPNGMSVNMQYITEQQQQQAWPQPTSVHSSPPASIVAIVGAVNTAMYNPTPCTHNQTSTVSSNEAVLRQLLAKVLEQKQQQEQAARQQAVGQLAQQLLAALAGTSQTSSNATSRGNYNSYGSVSAAASLSEAVLPAGPGAAAAGLNVPHPYQLGSDSTDTAALSMLAGHLQQHIEVQNAAAAAAALRLPAQAARHPGSDGGLMPVTPFAASNEGTASTFQYQQGVQQQPGSASGLQSSAAALQTSFTQNQQQHMSAPPLPQQQPNMMANDDNMQLATQSNTSAGAAGQLQLGPLGAVDTVDASNTGMVGPGLYYSPGMLPYYGTAHPTALAHMHPMMAAAAMGPTAMLVPAAVLAAPAVAPAAAAQSFAGGMQFGMYPVPFPLNAAAQMQYFQMLQQQQQYSRTAAGDSEGGISTASTSQVADIMPTASLATAASSAADIAADSSFDPACSSSLTAVVCRSQSNAAAAAGAVQPGHLSLPFWSSAVAWLLGKRQAWSGMQHQDPYSQVGNQSAAIQSITITAHTAPRGLVGRTKHAAAQGLGLVTYSSAAIAHMYLMVFVWYAHYQLVLVLYALLGVSSAAVASQQLVWRTGKAAVGMTVQLGVFAVQQGRLFTGAAAKVVTSDLQQLPQQLLLQPLLSVPSRQLLMLESAAPNTAEGQPGGAVSTDGVVVGSANSGSTVADSLQIGSRSTIMTRSSSRGLFGLWSYLSGGSSSRGGPAAEAYSTADKQQSQQDVVIRSSNSIAAPLQLPTQHKQHSLKVVDSVSVISGLWVGLGLKLWMLFTVRVPFEASCIWMNACSQGISLSLAAGRGAIDYVLHAAWLILQCSSAILASTSMQLPYAGFAAVGVARHLCNRAATVAYQLTALWWRQLGGPVAAAQAWLLTTAAAVPGGFVAVQLIDSSVRVCTAALQMAVNTTANIQQWLATADKDALQAVFSGRSLQSVASQLLRWTWSAGLWLSGEFLHLAERMSVVVTTRALRDAPPMAQAAVWGSAGMLKRLAVELTQQSWLLLMQMYQAWQLQRQQQLLQVQQ